MIRAVIRDGSICPIDPLPEGWSEGQELEIEAAPADGDSAEIDRWAQKLEALTSRLDNPEDWSRFQAALEEADRLVKRPDGERDGTIRLNEDSASLPTKLDIAREIADRISEHLSGREHPDSAELVREVRGR